jgi:hypothetical protein
VRGSGSVTVHKGSAHILTHMKDMKAYCTFCSFQSFNNVESYILSSVGQFEMAFLQISGLGLEESLGRSNLSPSAVLLYQ